MTEPSLRVKMSSAKSLLINTTIIYGPMDGTDRKIRTVNHINGL